MNQLDCLTVVVFVVAGIGILGVLVTIRAVVHDGYGRVPDRSPRERVSRWH